MLWFNGVPCQQHFVIGANLQQLRTTVVLHWCPLLFLLLCIVDCCALLLFIVVDRCLSLFIVDRCVLLIVVQCCCSLWLIVVYC